MADMHTPLPWETRLSRDGSGDVGITADGLPNVLAEVFGDIRYAGERNQMEATANALLIVTAVNERPALLARASRDAETIKALEAQIATKNAALLKWAEYDQILRSLPGEGPLYGGQMANVDAAYDACRDATEAALAKAEGR